MAYTASQPVKEVPGFARVGQAVRKGVLAALNPIFGTPENPTRLGKAVALAEEASQYGLMAGPATGMMRYAVRAPLTVDPRFLGTGTIPLPNVQRSVSKAFVPRSGFSSMPRDIQAVREGLMEGKKVLVPKSMFSNAPGDFAYLDDVGNVVIPDSTASLIKRYNDRYVRVTPPGSKTPRAVSMTEVEKMAKNVDKANAPYDLKQANLRALSDAVNPYWQYWMYERDIASLNKTLAKYRAPKDRATGNPVFYKNQENLSFDVLSAEAAQTVLSNLPGTGYRLSTPGFGAVDYMPNHVSAMSRDRFVRPGSTLFDLYNDGYLPYQSATFLGAERKVGGRTVRPIMRVTDHHEFLDAPDGFRLSRVANKDFPRVYHVGREVPSYKFTPVDPGDIEAVYRFDGKPVTPSTGRYTASIGLQQASKGGDSPHKNFRNFLASDKVPESIFGYRVVQRAEDYTPEDVEFFRANPKAAGFYDLGDGMDEDDGTQEAFGAGVSMLASIFGPVGLENLRKAGWKNLPKLASYRGHGHEIQIGELKDVRLRKGWEQALLWKDKRLSDILDFSSPQGERLTVAYPGIQDIIVTNEDRGDYGAYGAHGGAVGRDEYIWLNPRYIGVRGGDVAEQYDTILHEGINHAIYAREPSFVGPRVTTHIKGGGELTPLGYAMSLNEVLADLASRRGAMRAETGRGSADSEQLVSEIFPHMVRRVQDLSAEELHESQRKMLVEDLEPTLEPILEPVRAAEPADEEDLPLEEPAEDVPQQAAKAGRTYDTRLTTDQERRYQAWRATLPKRLQYEGDYDLRGYWADPDTVKEGIVDGQHFTDRYKKPNHPTFSVESKYATGENRDRAGRWDGDRFIPPRGKYPGLTNNPGNVEKHELRTDKTLFEGEDGGGVRPKRFARFTDPVLGLKASATVLARKADELAKAGKPFTIENYAPLYAPPNENDTEGYIENLSRYSGIARNAKLDRWDVGSLARLLKAKVRFETSPEASRWFTDEEYEEAAEKLQEGVFD